MTNEKRERVTILTKKDLDISYYIGPGAGGQNKQKNATGVQIIHRETGAIGRCSESRLQSSNKKKAFQRLCATPKMKFWINAQIYKIHTGKTLDEQVDEMMAPKNLKFEYYIPNE